MLKKERGLQFVYRGKQLSYFPDNMHLEDYYQISFANTPILSFKNFPVLPKLEILILDNTLINNLMYAMPQPNLRKLYLRNTPFSRYNSQEIMCSIVFGSNLKFYNGKSITEESILISSFMASDIRPYLLQGWVIISMNPVKLLNTKTQIKKILFPIDDAGRLNRSHSTAQLTLTPKLPHQTGKDHNLTSSDENFISPLTRQPQEAFTEAFYDALDLTSQWNHIRKPNYPKHISAKDGGKGKKKESLIKIKPKSIIETRSIVRDHTMSIDNMPFRKPQVPECVDSPFKPSTRDHSVISMRSLKRRAKIARGEVDFDNFQFDEYSTGEVTNSESEDIDQSVKSYKDALKTGTLLFSPKDRPHAEIVLEPEEQPEREAYQAKVISLADEIANSSQSHLLKPMSAKEEQQKLTDERIRILTKQLERAKARRANRFLTPQRINYGVRSPRSSILMSSDMSKESFSIDEDTDDSLAIDNSSTMSLINSPDENPPASPMSVITDQELDDEQLLFEAQEKFLQLFPGQEFNDSAMDAFVDQYIADHKQNKK